MVDSNMLSQLTDIRNRLSYAERNVNSHILEDTSISGKVQIDSIVLSILRNSKDSLVAAYAVMKLDSSKLIAAFDNAMANCDNPSYTYEDRKRLVSDLKRFTYVEGALASGR